MVVELSLILQTYQIKSFPWISKKLISLKAIGFVRIYTFLNPIPVHGKL